MHSRLILPTGLCLASLLAPDAWAQTPPWPGKSPPLASQQFFQGVYSPAPHAPALFPPPAPQPLYAAPAPAPAHVITPGQPRSLTWGPGPIGLSLGWAGRQLQRFDQQHTWVLWHHRARPVTPAVVVPTPAVIIIPTPAPVPAPVAPTPPPGLLYVVPVPASTVPVSEFRATPQSRDEEAPPAPATPAASMRLVPPMGDIMVLPPR